MLSPIMSVKHYAHLTNGTQGTGTIARFELVTAAVAPATGNATDVQEGSHVKALYVEMWVAGDGASGSDTQYLIAIEKRPSNLAVMTFAESLNLGAYHNKKNILFTAQAFSGAMVDGYPAVPVIRGWIKIPKGKQRMGALDRITLNIQTNGASLRRCGFVTFKEYR